MNIIQYKTSNIYNTGLISHYKCGTLYNIYTITNNYNHTSHKYIIYYTCIFVNMHSMKNVRTFQVTYLTWLTYKIQHNHIGDSQCYDNTLRGFTRGSQFPFPCFNDIIILTVHDIQSHHFWAHNPHFYLLYTPKIHVLYIVFLLALFFGSKILTHTYIYKPSLYWPQINTKLHAFTCNRL